MATVMKRKAPHKLTKSTLTDIVQYVLSIEYGERERVIGKFAEILNEASKCATFAEEEQAGVENRLCAIDGDTHGEFEQARARADLIKCGIVNTYVEQLIVECAPSSDEPGRLPRVHPP